MRTACSPASPEPGSRPLASPGGTPPRRRTRSPSPGLRHQGLSPTSEHPVRRTPLGGIIDRHLGSKGGDSHDDPSIRSRPWRNTIPDTLRGPSPPARGRHGRGWLDAGSFGAGRLAAGPLVRPSCGAAAATSCPARCDRRRPDRPGTESRRRVGSCRIVRADGGDRAIGSRNGRRPAHEQLRAVPGGVDVRPPDRRHAGCRTMRICCGGRRLGCRRPSTRTGPVGRGPTGISTGSRSNRSRCRPEPAVQAGSSPASTHSPLPELPPGRKRRRADGREHPRR